MQIIITVDKTEYADVADDKRDFMLRALWVANMAMCEGFSHGKIQDINGNTVGQWEFINSNTSKTD